MTQQQRIDQLGFEFMGWTKTSAGDWLNKGVWVAQRTWNPFISLDDAHRLLEECERRGLQWKVGADLQASTGARCTLMATPEQITNTVWAVAELGEKDGTEADKPPE